MKAAQLVVRRIIFGLKKKVFTIRFQEVGVWMVLFGYWNVERSELGSSTIQAQPFL